MNSSKQFRCGVMFESELKFSSLIRHFRTTRMTLIQCHGGGWESITWGWTCFGFPFSTVVRDCWVAF
jgi:hypothetical protein